MFLKSLTLTNFRNYSKLDFKFKAPVTIFYGDNAQGKSNFLESIYFLATSKSPKAEKEDELVKSDEEVLRVEGKVSGSVSQYVGRVSKVSNSVKLENTDLPINTESTDITELGIAMQLEGLSVRKKISVNKVPRRVSEYSQNLAVVLFSPEDINLVTGSPSLRRTHIDHTLSQVDKNYKKAISAYENVVVRKNRILKRIRENQAGRRELSFWIDQQIMLGEIIHNKRVEFFEFLKTIEKKFGEFHFEYIQSIVTKERLAQYLDKEIDAATSLIGPHRDDFIFKLNDLDLARFGSRGEQRTAVLDLKIAEVEFMEEKLSSRPILLLDDIFSELDVLHRQHVVDLSKLQQTIIATVEFDQYLKEAFSEAIVYLVNSGTIKKLS